MNAEPEIRIIKPSEREIPNSPDMRWVESISKWMDSKFYIPGTNIRIGLDPLFSLVPILGDLATFIISSALIYIMYNHGASRKVVIKMMLNATLDTIIGAIPVVGTVFDIFYRSNERNVKLLKEHYFEGKHQGSGNGMLIFIFLLLISIIALAFYGMYKLFELIF